ncbi:MAG: endonuclease [Pseudomonadota bacterium]
MRHLICAIVFCSVPVALAAQTVEELRSDLQAALKTGHLPIAFSQTDEAMAELYADPLAPGNIVLFYTGRSQNADLWVNVDAQDGWNREHLWPQSRGVRPAPMKSDLHALRPTDASVNQRRGNLNFDEGGDPEGEAPNTFRDADSFEPRDEVKGDVARALFYMDVRYEVTCPPKPPAL